MVPFVTVDVFTDRRFGGNQLAVVTDARGLDTPTMQAIAAEFGYAETTFVLPPRDPANTAQVRIFTPAREMPFAGHPNVGTAFVLASAGVVFGKSVGDRVLFEEEAGLVPLDIQRRDRIVSGATLTAPQPLACGGIVDIGLVAACAGLTPSDILTRNHVPHLASVGNPFVFAEVVDRAALGRAAPDVAAFRQAFPKPSAVGLHIYVRSGNTVYCRMFAPLAGVPEDAATGSANVALVALLAKFDPAPDVDLALHIHQGAEMGRPSLLHASAVKSGGRVTTARVGGGCVHMMEGRITSLPPMPSPMFAAGGRGPW